ncbi:MAG: 2-methylisocitrate lyase-like PEP mutase family enzyme [Halioglobus sp.]
MKIVFTMSTMGRLKLFNWRGRLAAPFVLTARAESYLHGRPDLNDTIARLQAYQEAGADVLYAPGLRTPEDIKTLVAAVDKPVNVIMGIAGVNLTLEQLTGVGVKRISLGSTLNRTALGAFMSAAREVLSEGTFSYAQHAVGAAELDTIFGAEKE